MIKRILETLLVIAARIAQHNPRMEPDYIFSKEQDY